MAENNRLRESTDWIDLEFMKNEWTPREIAETGIRHHLAGISLSNTVFFLDVLAFKRSRTAIHTWLQKAELQPTDGESLDRVAVDQKTTRIDDEQYWLYAVLRTADPF